MPLTLHSAAGAAHGTELAPPPPRRRLLGAAATLLTGPALGPLTALTLLSVARSPAQAAEVPLGWVRPRAAPPALALTDALGRSAPLAQLLGGRFTAVQLMFTGCTASCSAQGLLFATMAARPRAVPVNWLSISIDALGDDAPRLRSWQQRFNGGADLPQWRAAVPAMRDVDTLAQFLRGVPAREGTHTDQVFVFDREGRLAYRTGDRPEPHFLEQLLLALAAG